MTGLNSAIEILRSNFIFSTETEKAYALSFFDILIVPLSKVYEEAPLILTGDMAIYTALLKQLEVIVSINSQLVQYIDQKIRSDSRNSKKWQDLKKLMQFLELRILGENLKKFPTKADFETLRGNIRLDPEFQTLDLLLIQKYDSLHVRSRAKIEPRKGAFYDAPPLGDVGEGSASKGSVSHSSTGEGSAAASVTGTPGRSKARLTTPFASPSRDLEACPVFRAYGSFSGGPEFEAAASGEVDSGGGGVGAAASRRSSSIGGDSVEGASASGSLGGRKSIWLRSSAAYKIESYLLGADIQKDQVDAASKKYREYLSAIILLRPRDATPLSEEAKIRVRGLTSVIAQDTYAFLFFLEIHKDKDHGLHIFLNECGVFMTQDSKLPPRGVEDRRGAVVPAVNIWGTNRFPGKQNASNADGFEQIKRYAEIARQIQEQIRVLDSRK